MPYIKYQLQPIVYTDSDNAAGLYKQVYVVYYSLW